MIFERYKKLFAVILADSRDLDLRLEAVFLGTGDPLLGRYSSIDRENRLSGFLDLRKE